MVNLTQMRVQLNGQEQILIQAAFVLTKIAPMAQIGDVRKIPCREIFSAGDSCLYGPCALILNCFVISAVHCRIIDGYTHEYINQLIHYDSLQQIQSLSSLIAHSQNSKKEKTTTLNCTPSVRQHDILSNRWGVLHSFPTAYFDFFLFAAVCARRYCCAHSKKSGTFRNKYMESKSFSTNSCIVMG